MPGPRICVVGAANYDLISYVSRMPRWGETLHGHRFRMSFGGKGANQAVMAARLGAQVSMICKVGADVFGTDIQENFRRQGVDTSYVYSTSAAATGVAPIVVDDEGNNAIIIVMGANDLLSAADVERARAAIETADMLVCQLEIPLETTLAAMRLAHVAGVPVLANPAPARPDLPAAYFHQTDILCPNEPESEMLSGRPVTSLSEAEAAGRALLARGVRRVILTLGARGCLLVTADERLHVPAPRVQAVDTTGAGDAFVGALATFITQGMSWSQAMRRANQVAALSVQAPGAQSSYPALADLPDL